MRRSTVSLALIAAAALLASACTPAGAPSPGPGRANEVGIGLLAPLTGPSAAAGIEAKRGAELAADLVNAHSAPVQLPGLGAGGLPGLGGAKLKVVVADSRGDPTVAAAAAASLVSQARVAGVVGAFDAEVTAAASQRTERLQVPFVNGDTTANFLTERGLDWFFRVGPTDRALEEILFSALKQLHTSDPRISTGRVGIVYADDTASNGTLASALELSQEGGGFEVVAEEGFHPGGDPVGALAKVRGKHPDSVLLIASTGGDAAKLVDRAGGLGGKRPGLITLGSGFSDPRIQRVAGRDADGFFSSSLWSGDLANRNSVARPLVDLYAQRFQTPMTEVAASSFTAVLLLATAISDTGATDAGRVRTALLGLDIPGRDTIMPWDGVRFDASHQNTGATGLVEQQADGQRRVVFPTELVQGQGAVWPAAP